ncbi:hypothetical protein LV84_00369 [Algoriphagus ratkowskyi]|uniref:Uncharacterized protein n=1 Tax=Algoriphagus ratkowskyi TaxID=57028 RepID=A0A2W7RM97_9BACT|nr:hypothetical protein [Algoriphagus ratkowskyi]PZX61381.1 hypothetical protein LV84_00369 [Algoriphagus ratkowskyi]TXD79475.1 hypothetical protein ESW18_04420 [Algoriphagus ratkowskyi]
MIYLIWGVLNILLILSWLWIGFSLFFRRKNIAVGNSRPYSIFFVVGLLVLLSAKSKDSVAPKMSYNKPTTVTIVETGKTLTNHISIVSIRDKESGEILTQYTDSNLTGFMSGLDWEQSGVYESDGKLEVNGILSWRLFGINFFSQSKSFTEVISE